MTAPARTILIIDDEPDSRARLRGLLERQRRQYTVVEEPTGEAGLARCRELRPDCVLLDYYLPDMSGEAWLDELANAADAGAARILPVPVAVLAEIEEDDVAAGTLKRGAEDYLLKDNITAPALARAVENAIEKYRIRRELEEQRAAAEERNRRLESLRDELHARLAELADATRAKDRFLAVMSHEMRTPLNAVLGYAELLDLELDGPLTVGQRQQIERIRVGSRHLLDLINDLLDLARLDARRLELDVRPVAVFAVIEEVAALLEGQATAKGITLVAEPCAPDFPHVLADLQRFRQIMTNLVGNAIKFTERGSIVVQCGVSTTDGTVQVTVRDTGIGIPAEALPLVFTEFYQADYALTRQRGGSGLGLAIAQRLAQLMGGRITVESERGIGSSFTLHLQPAVAGSELRADDVALHDARMTAHAVGVRLSGEDDRAQSDVSVVAFGEDVAGLAELGHRVRGGVRLTWTTDPAAVRTLAARERAALVILDVGSGGGAAWQAAQALQEADELSTAVLLLPSILSTDGDEGAPGFDLGWVSLVPKPFTAEQITQAVAAAARGAGVQPRPAPGGQGGATWRYEVLVVDDDPDSRRVASKFLAEASVIVREAADGETALAEMRARLPDVVVLDLMMPVLDGFGVLATIRADPLLARLPVVVLTAKSLTEAERQFLSRSAVRVLQKGEHRLADVAALVLRAAARAERPSP